MSINLSLLDTLTRFNGKNSPKYLLYLNNVIFSVTDVSIVHSPTPVNEPTTRGGVYFSDKFAYKMKGTIDDLSIVPLLTNNMLGPSTEFGNLKIVAQVESDGKTTDIEITANLTNSVQTPNFIELSMIIIKLESC